MRAPPSPGRRDSRVDPAIDFNWRAAPTKGVELNSFSVRWTGQLRAIEGGLYTIRIESAGGVRLWIDGQSVIYNWKHHALATDDGTISLAAGRRHDLRMQYYHTAGDALVKLSWKRPGRADFEIIPKSQLYSAPTLDYSASWIGNTFARNGPFDVDGAFVWPDGTIYSVGGSGEGGGRIAAFRDGEPVSFAGATCPGGVGSAIIADLGYIYASGPVSRAAPGGLEWAGAGVRRFLRSTGNPAPFENGQGADGSFWQISAARSAPGRPASRLTIELASYTSPIPPLTM